MQLFALIRIGEGDRLVKFDAEARFVRGDDVTFLPDNRLLEDLRKPRIDGLVTRAKHGDLQTLLSARREKR